MATGPIELKPTLSWWQRNPQGEAYVAFHREPLSRVADSLGDKYIEELRKIENKENENNIGYLGGLIEQRRKLCDARLQAAKGSKNSKERSKILDWERELWYSEIALNILNSSEPRDTRVLRCVTRAIAGEMIALNNQLTLKGKANLEQKGSLGEIGFERRIGEFVALADNFKPSPKMA